MQEEVRALVEKEQTSRAVAMVLKDEVGTGDGMECHLDGHGHGTPRESGS